MLLHATRSKTAFHLAIGQHLMVRSKIEPLWVVLEASNVGHVSRHFVINQLVILACPHVHAAKQRSFSLISAIRQNGHSNAIARTSKRHTHQGRGMQQGQANSTWRCSIPMSLLRPLEAYAFVEAGPPTGFKKLWPVCILYQHLPLR